MTLKINSTSTSLTITYLESVAAQLLFFVANPTIDSFSKFKTSQRLHWTTCGTSKSTWFGKKTATKPKKQRTGYYLLNLEINQKWRLIDDTSQGRFRAFPPRASSNHKMPGYQPAPKRNIQWKGS